MSAFVANLGCWGFFFLLQKIHKTAERQNEEVELLDQLALAWRVLVASQIGDEVVGHAVVASTFTGGSLG